MLGNLNPRDVAAPGRILIDVHAYKSKYNKVLEQLVDRHRMFENLSDIMGIPDAALDKYELQMNMLDDKLDDFMLSDEKKCRAFKNDNIEWSPTVKIWLGRKWVIARLQKFIAKEKALSIHPVLRLQRLKIFI